MADTSTALTTSIINSLLSNSKYSSLSKITITNYGSGSANSIPIGYTDAGVPIYDTGEAALNDDLKDAISKKHLRNTDTILKGPGTNSIENTSSGNIINFISQGIIKAVITDQGFFTGKIKLENIDDLDNLTIDTSNFFTKQDTSSLLDAKVSKKDLYTSDDKIDSTLIDVDITRKSDFDAHKTDMVSHITNSERTNWNSKYYKPTTGVPLDDLDAGVSDKITKSALDSDLRAHIADTVSHVTSDQKARWNAKFDLPVTGIPETMLESAVRQILDGAAMESELTAHKGDTVAHITNSERTSWNGKYLKPASGIPLADLETVLQGLITSAAPQANLDAHTANTDIHITSSERVNWNAKYVKADTGIPETDLESALKTKIDTALPSATFNAHASNTTVHITADERTAWNAHKADTVVHITSDERSKWNAKFDLPATGIIETMLSASLQTKINSYATSTDFNQHITDSVVHITQGERDTWNAKYVKPTNGIPESDLSLDLSNKIDKTVTIDAFNNHIEDSIAHTTSAEKASWNAKYLKPATGIPFTDLASDVSTSINGLVASGIQSVGSALEDHTGNSVIHVTSENKTNWNAKYDKPTAGIPFADLAANVMTNVQNAIDSSVNTVSNTLNNHTSNSDIHILVTERTAWNAKYDKPTNGIPFADLASDVTSAINGDITAITDPISEKLDTHIADEVVHITADERTAWNAKYLKAETGIPFADLASDVTDAINGDITVITDPINTALSTHSSNTTIHVTADERTAWNAKYLKAETGIPFADLASDVLTSIVSTIEPSIDAKYTKAETGIPESDLEASVVTKLNKIDFFTFEVTEATKTVTIETTNEHALHANQFEYSTFAYASNVDKNQFTLIQPASVVISNTIPANGETPEVASNITLTFTDDFVGQILVR